MQCMVIGFSWRTHVYYFIYTNAWLSSARLYFRWVSQIKFMKLSTRTVLKTNLKCTQSASTSCRANEAGREWDRKRVIVWLNVSAICSPVHRPWKWIVGPHCITEPKKTLNQTDDIALIVLHLWRRFYCHLPPINVNKTH